MSCSYSGFGHLVALVALFAFLPTASSGQPARTSTGVSISSPRVSNESEPVIATSSVTFTDVTFDAGIAGPLGGHAAIFADVTANGLPDLYITYLLNGAMPDLFFRNLGDGRFREEAALRGIASFDGGSHGATFADFDNDGHFDLYNATTEGAGTISAQNRLFRNLGNGFFIDATDSAGLPARAWPTRAVVAFDMDGDGDLDIFCVTNYLGSEDPPGERNEVYRNDGGLRFTSINSGALFEAPAGQGAIDTDYNNDGRIDIITANRTGPVNVLRNDGNGQFTYISGRTIGIDAISSDGITTADIDNDGDLDLLVVRDDEGWLYLNLGNGTFQLKQIFRNVDGYMGGFADLDNDGDLDLVFAGDNLWYENDGTGRFRAGGTVPIGGINDPRAIAFADIDGDGDLDFAIGSKRSRSYLIRNNFNSGNWLKVQLISPQGQAGAFGARARIYRVGDRTRLLGLREARSNAGYLGQDDPVLHFGLGDQDAVDIEVTFLDGTLVTRKNVAARQTILIDGRVHDTKPPVLDSIAVELLDAFTARITWRSNELATSQVDFGADSSAIRQSPQSRALVTRHQVELHGLLPATRYAFLVRSRDAAGNEALAAGGFFTTTALDSNRHRIGTLWSPYLEWALPNRSFSGNPFDLQASATFVHHASGERITTGLFYAGDSTWKFRFAGTQTGYWSFTTRSDDPDLAGQSGTVEILPNPGAPGFVTHIGNKWARSGTGQVYVPQLAMYVDPDVIYRDPARLDGDIETFFGEHGFNGFHVQVYCRWFDIDERVSDRIRDPNPDFRTFEALELLITRVYQAGGVVHLWAWGDEQRRQTPVRWGINGVEDRRLQRYIAARLGPLPGWTMGYGYDLYEWVGENDIRSWHNFMHANLGWRHLLGGRAGGPQNYSEGVTFPQIYDGLDYSSYEQHKPDLDAYLAAMAARPGKPVFSEDRFRMRNENREKDYNMEETRRGLWHSTLAGGVANIWGNLLSGDTGVEGSEPYPNPEMIRTYATFFANRFHTAMEPDNSLSDGAVLRLGTGTHLIAYKEETGALRIDLTTVTEPLRLVAVDTRLPYRELVIDTLRASEHVWRAPYVSDWALAAGDFDRIPADITAPEIGEVQIDSVTDSTATITWRTDEPSSAQIDFGPHRQLTRTATGEPGLRLQHQIQLTGLDAATTYFFRIRSRDAAGNLAIQADLFFSTSGSDTRPPQLLDLRFDALSTTSATISWRTDEPALARVAFGSDSSRAQTLPIDSSYSVEHTARLTGLRPGTTYYLRTDAVDRAGNIASLDTTFRTAEMPAYTVRVNAGGPAHNGAGGRQWSADRAFAAGGWGYDGGSTFQRNDAIAGTADPILYQSERWGMQAYRFSVPAPGSYQVTLHFAEIYFTAPEKRIFSVAIEGETRLQSLDIFATAGHDVAVRYSFAVDVNDGVLDIDFLPEIEDPKISAIEVESLIPDETAPAISALRLQAITTTSATVVWQTDEPATAYVEFGIDSTLGQATPLQQRLASEHRVTLTGLQPGTTYALRVHSSDRAGNAASRDTTFSTAQQPAFAARVNAGGPAYTGTDGRQWPADRAYSPGGWGHVAGNSYQRRNPIAGTDDDAIYQTERWGLQAYRFTVPAAGSYSVALHFAEIHFNAAGKRVFSIAIEGETVLRSFDIFAVIGSNTALVRTFTVDVQDGVLDIEFLPEVEDPKISAIEVIALPGAAKLGGQPEPAASPQLPERFALSPNYPNPFNAETRLTLALPQPGWVRAIIYTLGGQEAARLLDAAMEAGVHHLRWDGRSQHGLPAGSGLYFLRVRYRAMNGETFVETKRLTLLK